MHLLYFILHRLIEIHFLFIGIWYIGMIWQFHILYSNHITYLATHRDGHWGIQGISPSNSRRKSIEEFDVCWCSAFWELMMLCAMVWMLWSCQELQVAEAILRLQARNSGHVSAIYHAAKNSKTSESRSSFSRWSDMICLYLSCLHHSPPFQAACEKVGCKEDGKSGFEK